MDRSYEEAVADLVQFVADRAANSVHMDRVDAQTWTTEWLAQPNAALGLLAPYELMHTHEGRGVVAGILTRMLSNEGQRNGH